MSIGQNLQSLLEASAGENTGNVIVYGLGNVAEPQSYSYSQLLEASKKASKVLRSRRADFPLNTVVLLHFDSHWECIVWFWAVLFAGCLPAISTALSNNDSVRLGHLHHLAVSLKSPACLTKASLLHEFGGQEQINPTAIESLHGDNVSSEGLDDIDRSSKPDDIAVLMLTSGSTSKAKAVCLTHAQIMTAVAGKYGVVHLPKGTSFLNWVRLDHVAALVEIHLQALFACADQVHVQARDLISNPLQFLSLIERHCVSRTFAPNFFLANLRVALQETYKKDDKTWDLSSLRYIASGGEANLTKNCEAVSNLLSQYGTPENVIIPGFGMTETCAGAIFNTTCPRYDLERALEFTSVGSCMPGISMRITEGPGHQAVAPGVVGNLEIAGPVVTIGYFNNPSANEESFTDDGFFMTGDRASIDEMGYLTLAGRVKETMIVNGAKFSPQEIESVLDAATDIPGLTPSFTCCFSFFPKDGDTEELCIIYLPAYSPEDTQARVYTTDAISNAVLMTTGCRPHVLPLDLSQLQKSALGKLSRSKLKASFEAGQFESYNETNAEAIQLYRQSTRIAPKTDMEKRLLDLFIRSLGLSEEYFDVQTPVLNMGVSSIDLIKLKKNIEEHLCLIKEVPMITLMTNTTVRDLSIALEELQQPHKYNPVVTLQSRGEKTPLWLIHPGVGEVLVFLNLAKFLIDRKVYALRARGFNDGEKPFETIQEVVRTYHASIKKKQPFGPYALAGYSYGSMLAFEVGKVLESNGDQVKFLGSFNLPPHIKARMRQLDWKECLLHLSYFLDLMTEKYARELATALRGETRETALVEVMKVADQARLSELSLSAEALNKWATLAFALQSMAVDYDPSGSIEGMDIFYCIPLAVVASSKAEWQSQHLSKWSDFTRSEPRFHDVGGAHYTMLGPEHVFNFQRTLRKALDARGI